MQTVRLESRLLIGRSEHNDISIGSRFVSRHHALLVRHGNSTFLMDLNSTNGTTVNSREVEKAILKNNDIISLGRHRLKLENAPAIPTEIAEQIQAADTMVLKSLDDLRRSRARRTISALKHK